MTNLPDNIRTYRKKQHLSQEALAKKLYVTRQTISNYENGKTEPDLNMIKRIADVLNVDMHELIQNQSTVRVPKIKLAGLILLVIMTGMWAFMSLKSLELSRSTYRISWGFIVFWPFAASILFVGIGYLMGSVLTDSRILKRIEMPGWLHKMLIGLTSVICVGLMIVLIMFSIYYWMESGGGRISPSTEYLYWNQIRADVMMLFSFHPILYGIFPVLGLFCSYSKK